MHERSIRTVPVHFKTSTYGRVENRKGHFETGAREKPAQDRGIPVYCNADDYTCAETRIWRAWEREGGESTQRSSVESRWGRAGLDEMEKESPDLLGIGDDWPLAALARCCRLRRGPASGNHSGCNARGSRCLLRKQLPVRP